MAQFIIEEIQSQSHIGFLCLIGVFFYVGLITIGGGQVAITVMHQTLVENFQLLSDEKFFNMVAISESTPGPIGINIATYIGTELYGVFGGLVTTFGEVLPSLICIILIAKYFGKFSEKKGVQAAFSTLRPAVSGVIAVAAAKIIMLALVKGLEKANLTDIASWSSVYIQAPSAVFYLLCLLVLFKTKLHPVFIVLLGGVFGVFFC